MSHSRQKSYVSRPSAQFPVSVLRDKIFCRFTRPLNPYSIFFPQSGSPILQTEKKDFSEKGPVIVKVTWSPHLLENLKNTFLATIPRKWLATGIKCSTKGQSINLTLLIPRFNPFNFYLTLFSDISAVDGWEAPINPFHWVLFPMRLSTSWFATGCPDSKRWVSLHLLTPFYLLFFREWWGRSSWAPIWTPR